MAAIMEQVVAILSRVQGSLTQAWYVDGYLDRGPEFHPHSLSRRYDALTETLEPIEEKRMGRYYYDEDELRERYEEDSYDSAFIDCVDPPTVDDRNEE